MAHFKVHFPDRVLQGEHAPACSCMMVACDKDRAVKRGVTETVQGNTRQEVWERMRGQYPFERIEVKLA